MMLYKYVSFEAGLKILECNSIGFSEPRDFNDPFETAARFKGSDSGQKAIIDGKEVVLRPVFSNLNNALNPWSHNVAVLSLTRQPMNKLMLAHYSDNHKGMVIGFDVSSVQEFTSSKFCYIPAQYGSVVYTETLPTFDLLDDTKSDWESCSYETRQRALLHKDMTWSMEEEVRVVVSLRDYQKRFDVITLNERPLYLYELPSGTITEVYLGCRAPILPATDGEHSKWLRLKKLFEKQKKCKPYQLILDGNSWNVKSQKLHIEAYDSYWQLHHDRRQCD